MLLCILHGILSEYIISLLRQIILRRNDKSSAAIYRKKNNHCSLFIYFMLNLLEINVGIEKFTQIS